MHPANFPATLGLHLAEAGRIVAGQRALVEKLKELKLPTLDAERSLQMYISSLTHLLAHKRKLKENKPHTETLSNNDIRRQRLRRQEDFRPNSPRSRSRSTSGISLRLVFNVFQHHRQAARDRDVNCAGTAHRDRNSLNLREDDTRCHRQRSSPLGHDASWW